MQVVQRSSPDAQQQAAALTIACCLEEGSRSLLGGDHRGAVRGFNASKRLREKLKGLVPFQLAGRLLMRSGVKLLHIHTLTHTCDRVWKAYTGRRECAVTRKADDGSRQG